MMSNLFSTIRTKNIFSSPKFCHNSNSLRITLIIVCYFGIKKIYFDKIKYFLHKIPPIHPSTLHTFLTVESQHLDSS